MDIIIPAATAIGFISGGLISFFFSRSSSIPKASYEQLKSELTLSSIRLSDRETEIVELKADSIKNKDELQNLRQQVAVLHSEKKNLNLGLEKELEAFERLQKIHTSTETLLGEARERVVMLNSEKASLEKRVEQHAMDIEELHKKFTLQFENLANRIFEEKSSLFKAQSQENLMQLLNPLKEKLGEFQKTVHETFNEETRERYALKKEIDRIVKVNEQMSLQAENLTSALKGDVKAQGSWGEVVLEKILEESGLRKELDYTLQGKDLGLRHPETGNALKPDVVVKLPDNKHLIIDSKVSLEHYRRYCSAADDEERGLFLKQYVMSVKSHVTGLEKRRYQDTDSIGTPDFVLMFVPIEGAYSLGLQSDRELHTFAWEKRIAIVSPTSLFATLRTIASMWRIELQNQNTLEIAKRGGALYDKFVAFVEDLQKMGAQLQTVQRTYESSMKKLHSGSGNLIRQTELLKELGAKASKNIPSDLTQLSEDTEEENSKLIQKIA